MRLEPEFAQLLDAKRIALQKEMGVIPTRSDVAHLATERYMNAGAPRK